MKITATLKNARLQTFHSGIIAIGNCYGDTRGRFEDGRTICTSLVNCVTLDTITTLNSTYKIESWS